MNAISCEDLVLPLTIGRLMGVGLPVDDDRQLPATTSRSAIFVDSGRWTVLSSKSSSVAEDKADGHQCPCRDTAAAPSAANISGW